MNTPYPNLNSIAQVRSLVLGSASPRRLRLLTETGVRFSRIVSNLEENLLPDEQPYHYATRLAEDKGLAVAMLAPIDAVVVGCDTIVVLDGRVLEKPVNEEDAFQILSLLSGKRHVVCSAAAFVTGKTVLSSGYELTNVYFNQASTAQVREYIASGEPMDKAGAYGIQGMGAFLVDRIEGNLDTVIGLPRALLEKLAGEVLVRIQ